MAGILELLTLLVTGLSLISCGNGSDQFVHQSPSVDINPPDVGINTDYGMYAFAVNATNNTYITGVRLRDDNHKPITDLDLQLECYIERQGQPRSSNFSWSKDNREIGSNNIRVKGQKFSILTILRLNKTADDGQYTCTIANEAGKGEVGKYFLMRVGTFPVVGLTGPKRPLTSSDRNVTLTCIVTATPPATIQWYLDDELIGNHTSSTYVIAEPGPADGGLYKCTATNHIGTGLAVYRVEVYYAPVGKPVVEPNILAIVANTTNTFSCNIQTLEDPGNPRATRYTWMYNNKTMITEEDQQVIIYQSSIKDVVQLSCLLVNYYKGSEQSPTADVKVEAPVLFEGLPVPPGNETEYTYTPDRNDRTFQLQYLISGTSVSSIHLYRNSSNLDVVTNKDFKTTQTDKEGNYSFKQTSAKEVAFKWNLDKEELKELDNCSRLSYFNGLYSLRALGTAGGSQSEATTTFKIAAKFGPTWHGKTTVNANIGEELKIDCSVCASPEPSGYKWDFNSGSLGSGIETENGGKTLLIKSVTDDHIGYYGCDVSYESTTKKFRVTVSKEGPSLSVGVIAGIVVGIVVIVGGVIIGIIIFRRNRTSDGTRERRPQHAPTIRDVNPQRPSLELPTVQRGPTVPKTPRPGASGVDGPYQNVPKEPPLSPRKSAKQPKKENTLPKSEEGVTEDIYEVIDNPEDVYVNMEDGRQEDYVVPNTYTRDPSQRL